jgi:hypothetical protein
VTALRLIDLVLVWLTVPVALLLGAPALGILVAAAGWTVQRVVALQAERRAREKEDVRQALGLNLAVMFGRLWLLAVIILAVGLAGSREDGVAAAALLLAAFTLAFSATLLDRSLNRKPTHA